MDTFKPTSQCTEQKSDLFFSVMQYICHWECLLPLHTPENFSCFSLSTSLLTFWKFQEIIMFETSKVLAFETPLTLKSFNDHSRALAKRLNIFIQHRVCQTIEHVINVGWLNGPVHSVRWRNHCSQGNKQCLTKHSTKRVHRTIFAYCCWNFYILWFIWFLKHVFIEVIATSAY